MADYSICSQVLWLDLFVQKKLYFSPIFSSDQVKITSGDGFSVCLPAQLLLASSGLIRSTFNQGMSGQDVFLPSVKGATLLLLVEILRSGVTGSLGKMGTMGSTLKEVQDLMKIIQIPGCVGLMRIKSGSIGQHERTNYSRRLNNNFPAFPILNSPTLNEDSSIALDTVQIRALEENNQEKESKVEPLAISPHIKAEPRDNVEEGVNTDALFKCKVCGNTFLNKTGLRSHHLSLHKETLFPCAYCNKKFILQVSLQTHVRARHEGDRISCEYCEDNFSNKENYHRHVKKNHLEQVHSCKQCGIAFVLEENLSRHTRSAHEGLFKCDMCHKTFYSEARRRVHVRKVHVEICVSKFQQNHSPSC